MTSRDGETQRGTPAPVPERRDPLPHQYTVEVDDKACEHCERGQTWTVVGPDGAGIGESFADQADAEETCEMLNAAFEEGLRRAALGSAPARPAQVWQPIETLHTGDTVIGHYVQMPERWCRVGLGCLDANGEWLWHQDVPWGPATHWQPYIVPDPPVSASSGETPARPAQAREEA